MLVPVIDVQNDNFRELWPAMALAFKTASFIAVDTELSGLGSRKALLAVSVEDRYKAVCCAARSRSILSVGIACYKKLEGKANSTYLVQVYNLTLLCAQEYVIEPQSVQFLVQHGFDFNKQYAQGVPYNKGNDQGGGAHELNMRNLFVELLRAKKPVIVHNGLIDMVFLYQCFYAQLPERLDTFVADLSEMFPAGIYDTKYAVEFELRFTASYLEYGYKKCKLDNSKLEANMDEPRLVLEFCNYTGHLESYVDYRPCSEGQSHDGSLNICIQFSAYGWCHNGAQCPMSHDTDLIIQQDEKTKENKRKKRKRRKKQNDDTPMGDEVAPQDKRPHMEYMEQDAKTSEPSQTCGKEKKDSGDIEPETKEEGNNTQTQTPGKSQSGTKDGKVEGGTHRAGFDAFMTGYIFAFASLVTAQPEDSEAQNWLPECLNKLYLSGKSVPLQVVKSSFSKTSKAHVQKMPHVWGKASRDNSSAEIQGAV